MRLLVGNINTEVVTGGADNLLKFNVEKVLKNYLSYRPNGYNHAPSYIDKKWDGWKSLYKFKKFPTGFLPMIITHMESKGVSITIEDVRDNPVIFKEAIPMQFGEYTLRDDQLDIVRIVSNHLDTGEPFYRGIIAGATNLGKTLVMASIKERAEGDTPCLLLVDRVKTFNQAVKDFSDWFDVGRVDGKHYEITDFTIGMVGAVKKALYTTNGLRDFMRFRMLYIDECHTAGSATFDDVLVRLNIYVRYLFSGTALDGKNKGNNLKIVGHGGPKLIEVGNMELMDKGVSLHVNVRILLNEGIEGGFKPFDREYNDNIIYSESRLEDMVKIITNWENGKQILIAFHNHRHGEYLLEELTSRCPGVVIEMAHGDDPESDAKMERFANKETQVLIGSTIFKQSVNIPCIQCIVYAIGLQDKIVIKQFIGRGIRKNGDEESINYYDWFDNSKYLDKHSRFRIGVYTKEGFDVEILYKANRFFTPKYF